MISFFWQNSQAAFSARYLDKRYGQIVVNMISFFWQNSQAAFSARYLDKRYGPFSSVLLVFQSFSVQTLSLNFSGSSVAVWQVIAAHEDVKTTRLTPVRLHDSRTFIVPFKAGSTRSFCGSS